MLKDYKILVKDEEESKEVQEMLFKLGYKWKNGGAKPMYLTSPVLTIYADGDICYGLDKRGFETHENEKLTVAQLKKMVDDVDEQGIKYESDKLEPIVSDGGSSDYYFTTLPKHLIDQIIETGGIEIKDIARYVYDNDADAFNIIKAQKRIIEARKGKGKAGIDLLYDANKIKFFASEQYEAIKQEGSL